MKRQLQTGTRPELAIRRLLHARGFRYRVDAQLPIPGLRRRADLLFSGSKVAVFVDGCYWHACPVHGTKPKANASWWSEKLAANVARDRDTDARLTSAGWTVVRIWEHESPNVGVERVVAAVRDQSSDSSSS
jgi:DNA mismatch endonuclease (patch repair protein)